MGREGKNKNKWRLVGCVVGYRLDSSWIYTLRCNLNPGYNYKIVYMTGRDGYSLPTSNAGYLGSGARGFFKGGLGGRDGRRKGKEGMEGCWACRCGCGYVGR